MYIMGYEVEVREIVNNTQKNFSKIQTDPWKYPNRKYMHVDGYEVKNII